MPSRDGTRRSQGTEQREPLMGKLRFVVVVPDEQAHTDEGKQELEGYDENIYHNG